MKIYNIKKNKERSMFFDSYTASLSIAEKVIEIKFGVFYSKRRGKYIKDIKALNNENERILIELKAKIITILDKMI